MARAGRESAAADASREAKRTIIAGYRFPKKMRLLRRSDFLAVQKTGRAVHGKHFLAVVASGEVDVRDSSRGRIGITVSKKVGNAVIRNRIKRLVREYVRQSSWLGAAAGRDTVIIAKSGAATLRGYQQVAAELSVLHARLVRRSPDAPERAQRRALRGEDTGATSRPDARPDARRRGT